MMIDEWKEGEEGRCRSSKQNFFNTNIFLISNVDLQIIHSSSIPP